MPISIILICLSFVLLILYIILHWTSYVAVKPSKDVDFNANHTQSVPSISVVIITHDSYHMLECVIDRVASQNYPKFEILVVNNASTDNTNDVIKQLAIKYPSLLRHTYLPQNRNGNLHMSIATTLGVRAARNEWIVLLRPTSIPKSSNWLTSIAQAINENHTVCIGYNDYYGYDNSNWEKKAIRRKQKAQILNYRAIFRGKRKPIETECSNLTFRKEDFVANKGYRNWLNIKNFHENLYVTTNCKPKEATFLTSHDSQVETILPPIKELWQTERTLMQKAYQKLSKATKLRRIHYSILTCVYLLSLITLSIGIYFVLCPLQADNSAQFIDLKAYTSELTKPLPIIPLCIAVLFLIISLIHYIYIIHRNRRDIIRLYSPLISKPSDFF